MALLSLILNGLKFNIHYVCYNFFVCRFYSTRQNLGQDRKNLLCFAVYRCIHVKELCFVNMCLCLFFLSLISFHFLQQINFCNIIILLLLIVKNIVWLLRCECCWEIKIFIMLKAQRFSLFFSRSFSVLLQFFFEMCNQAGVCNVYSYTLVFN